MCMSCKTRIVSSTPGSRPVTRLARINVGDAVRERAIAEVIGKVEATWRDMVDVAWPDGTSAAYLQTELVPNR